jgi:transposase
VVALLPICTSRIRHATRRHFSAEDKIRIVLEGLRGEDSIAELCRKEGIAQNLYYRWCKEFLEAGKKRLAGDTAREATSDEVKMLRAEARELKEALAEVTLENRLLKKKSDRGCGGYRMRYSASEKLEILRTVEISHLPVRRTLGKIGIPKTTLHAAQRDPLTSPSHPSSSADARPWAGGPRAGCLDRTSRPAAELRPRQRHGADQHGDPEVERGERRSLALHCTGQSRSRTPSPRASSAGCATSA